MERIDGTGGVATPGQREPSLVPAVPEKRDSGMTGTVVVDPTDRPTPLDVVASCALLFALAVAQPILDLLGSNAEFFLARDAPTIDIVTLAVMLTIVVPLALGVIAIVVGRVNRRAGEIVHGVILGLLAAVLAVQIIRRTPLEALPGWVEIVVAVVAGAGLVIGYRRSLSFRSVVRWGSLVPIAVLGLFLFASSASQLIVGSPAQAATSPVAIGNPAPVVFLIFDEFPVSSLMDGEGNLQEHLYPNFARLARDGTWYRNAVTVRHETENAVPAILTGVETRPGALPTLHDHPDNLFTLLDGTYDIEATEILTRLCPDDACGADDTDDTDDRLVQEHPPLSRRWRSLVSDLGVVAGHLFLPEDLTGDLPPIDNSWANFAAAAEADTVDDAADDPDGDPEDADPATDLDLREDFLEAIDEDRSAPFTRFLEGIEATDDESTLYFLHSLLPHGPWIYLPSGQLIDLPRGLPSRTEVGWIDDAWLVDQAYQLHLLQVQYVDTLVGEVIERLEDLGRYDDALIVVVSDHGVTIRPGMTRRRSTPETVADIPPVPLFIKAPHQASGGTDDFRAHTTDVMPTIADILDIDLSWTVDGMSLVAEDRQARTHSVISGDGGPVEFATDGSPARGRAADKVERFGPDGPFGLAPPGHADLLGAPVATLPVADPAAVTATLEEPGRFAAVDTSADVLPVMVRASLEGAATDSGVADDLVIAVTVNGEIAAITRTYADEGDIRFDAVLPPDSLRDGANNVELLLVEGTGRDRTFHPVGS